MGAEKAKNPLADHESNVERWRGALDGLDRAIRVADFSGGVQLATETRDLRTRFAVRLDHAEARLHRARKTFGAGEGAGEFVRSAGE